MRKLFIAIAATLLLYACDGRIKIKGNGHIVNEDRKVANAAKVKLSGSYDVELVNSPTATLRIEGDENVLPYIETFNENGWLIIRQKSGTRISTERNIKIFIGTAQLDAISLSGSGSIVGKNKFSSTQDFSVSLSGSGHADLQINAPSVTSEITGSGNINIDGETRKASIHISGHGDYKGENLMAEETDVHISGSGNARVYAEEKLDVHVSGSGDVWYKGKAANISKSISGSGSIEKINE
jgi:hypothetical protein